MDTRIIVVVPAYNEASKIQQVIREIKKHFPDIIVVDDGSSDGTERIARKEGVLVYHHIINRGLGGALGTGITAAVQRGADIVVTFDGDGQHRPDDIDRVIQPLLEHKADVVIGSRMLDRKGMPAIRRFYNTFGNIMTYLLFGVWTTDSQSGLRAFTREAASKFRLRTNKMEVSSEIIKEIRTHHLRFLEVPIQAIYTPYSLSKGQGLLTGMKTLIRLILLKIVK